MERLTIDEIIEHCDRKTGMYEKSCDIKHLETTTMNNPTKGYWEHKQVAEYLRKLKEYEGLEEQGRLIILPCKVGDTVYVDNTILPIEDMECYEDIDNKIPLYFPATIVAGSLLPYLIRYASLKNGFKCWYLHNDINIITSPSDTLPPPFTRYLLIIVGEIFTISPFDSYSTNCVFSAIITFLPFST
jgi:hypothetical protein